MADAWKQWEGHTVDGRFSLLRHLGGAEHSAVFLTERRVGGLLAKSAIKLVPSDSERADVQLSRWRQAAKLTHPHLIPLYEMGRCELDGMGLLYVVMEYAEESLAQVLPERALTPEESGGMLESVLDALAYLHGQGFVHGHIKPANILASGDQLKISSDGLCRAGELPVRPGYRDAHDPPEYAPGVIPATQTMAPEGDVWSVGMTLIEAVTQKLPNVRMDEQRDPLLPQTLLEPFLDIANHCLLRHPQSRWSVAQIAARLEGGAPAPQARATRPQAVAQPTAQKPIVVPSRPLTKRRLYVVPLAVGFAIVLAAVLVGPKLLRRHSEPPQAPIAAQTQPLAPPALSQQGVPPQQTPKKAVEKSVSESEEPSSIAPVPVSAAIHNEIANTEAKDAVAKVSSGFPAGKVAQQVDPEVLESARRSIRGTVKVVVRVDVDKSGNVEDADLESRGPSKYFARAALEAAKLWKFTPPELGNRGVLSSWTLRFEFTRDGTNVVPTQEAP